MQKFLKSHKYQWKKQEIETDFAMIQQNIRNTAKAGKVENLLESMPVSAKEVLK